MNYTTVTYDTPIMFQLKGGLYPLTALQLLGTDLTIFEQQLSAKIEQAPKFFHHAPVVIDLQKITHKEPILDFKRLIDILLHKKLIPVGIKGGTPALQAAANLAGLPTLLDNRKEPKQDTHKITATPGIATHKGSNTKIITEPVRSGQQIYARAGDLIILAPVSHGSELLADGHIHVYGPLRGRALAGITGDDSVHIFCQSLEAELISIAGQYKISEDMDQTTWQQSVDISLEAGHLHIRQL